MSHHQVTTSDFLKSNSIDSDGYLICANSKCKRRFEALYSSQKYCRDSCKRRAKLDKMAERYKGKKLAKGKDK